MSSSKDYEATFLLRNNWVAAMCGFADRRRDETGRSEDLPHTAAIKRNGGKVCHSCHLAVCRLLQGCETLPLTAVSDGSNIGAHFGAHNRAVGRLGVRCDKAECHCFRACRGDPGGVECLGKWGAGFEAASRPNGDKSPRHKGYIPTKFSDVRFIKSGGQKQQSPESSGLCSLRLCSSKILTA
jgi:hypothetical protein